MHEAAKWHSITLWYLIFVSSTTITDDKERQASRIIDRSIEFAQFLIRFRQRQVGSSSHRIVLLFISQLELDQGVFQHFLVAAAFGVRFRQIAVVCQNLSLEKKLCRIHIVTYCLVYDMKGFSSSITPETSFIVKDE
uniref:Secreted protein n=1 Tax=Romanomermis culicivorax TaxID=13658 RepID=A0A915KTI9_ROMCU